MRGAGVFSSSGSGRPPARERTPLRKLVIVASLFALAVPAAFAAPPSDKGKPDNPGANASAPGQSAGQNPAKACKAERAKDPVAFASTYGTNKNKRNAFGKCVSAKAKANAKQQGGGKDDD